MNTLLPALAALFSRTALAARTLFQRAAPGASHDGLEAYLSTATSLHQLEEMQRRWDRDHRGQHSFGTF
jgi:DMSO/TMAO reductase YedYZ molybdopterin-dependent catalytic subunit